MSWWGETWLAAMGEPPVHPDSREGSVQDVLADLITGHRCAYFVSYKPTTAGAYLLRDLWRAAFGDAPDTPSWFVSEYMLPVPPDLQDAIPFVYRSPDFVCGDGNRVLVLELKTERSSYEPGAVMVSMRAARSSIWSRSIRARRP